MRHVCVGSLVFGKGMPKICIPLMGETLEQIQQELEQIRKLPADLVEWRMDACREMNGAEDAVRLLREIRRVSSVPVLCTFRTKQEGGLWAVSPGEYVSLLESVIGSGCADLVDIELSAGDAVPGLLALAKGHGVCTVVSSHDFHTTPCAEELYSRMKTMAELGADLPKVAVMPHTAEDVLTLLQATCRANRDFGPVITMSMGALGAVSRVAGKTFGSCLTFGTATRASAPGQLEARQLHEMLLALHSNREGNA